jgi:hypothetical protein
MENTNQESSHMPADLAFRGLYQTGAVAAFLAALVFRRNLDAEWMLLRGMGVINVGPAAAPSTIEGWYSLLQQQPLLGLALLNVFDLVNFALVGLITLALAVALRKTNPSRMVIAAALGAAGVAVYFATNQAFPLLLLSRQYAGAVTEAQRAMLLAAGQAALAIHQSASFAGPGIYLSLLLVSSAGLVISITLLCSPSFGRATAIVGMLANGLLLSYYPVLALAPAWVAIPISISAIFLLVWYLQLGLRLWALCRRQPVMAQSVQPMNADASLADGSD